MFSKKEIEFMKNMGLEFDFSSLSDDELVRIEEAIGDIYTQEAQKTDKATAIILLCESILDHL